MQFNNYRIFFPWFLALNISAPLMVMAHETAGGPAQYKDAAITPDAQVTLDNHSLLTPDQYYMAEVHALGLIHAREHLQARNEERRLLAHPPSSIATVSTTNTDPSVAGSWSSPQALDTNAVAVHMVVLHDGKVLMQGVAATVVHKSPGPRAAFVYDPVTQTGNQADAPENVFCGGQNILADGRVLFVGGDDTSAVKPIPGLRTDNLFDPVTQVWSYAAPNAEGRWYPTVTQLASGQMLVDGGNAAKDIGGWNDLLEVYTPGLPGEPGTMVSVAEENYSMLYPRDFLLGTGNVLQIRGKISKLIDTTTWTSKPLASMQQTRDIGAAAVMLPAGLDQAPTKVMIAGGIAPGQQAALSSVEMLDTALVQKQSSLITFQRLADLPNPRSHMNLVLLPNGKVLGIGGNSTGILSNPQFAAILYDPISNAWSTLAPQVKRRAYHSTAVLLPDARVLSAGDNQVGGGMDTIEIYSPPYLFRGPRPVINWATRDLKYGHTIYINSGSSSVTEAVLIAPAATTHTADMHQRLLRLSLQVSPKGFTAHAPTNPAIAPPGYYMLFLLNDKGVPSIASWIHLT